MREFATPVQTCHLEAGGARFVGQGGLSVILWMAEGSEFDVVGHTCAFWAWASNRKFGFLVESSWLAWQSPRTVRRSQSHPSSAQEVEEVAEAAAALFGISVEQQNLMIQQIWSA